MTFASDTVRFQFHQLATAKQVEFVNLEDLLAKQGIHLQIVGVTAFDGNSEVIVRFTFEDKGDTLTCYNFPMT